MPTHIDVRPYNDPAYEPVWSAAEALRMPLTFHAGTGRSQTPAHGAGGAVINYVVTVGAPMETVAYLCGAGILERHPNLRVVMVECGSGWLAWAMHAMDDAYREHHEWVRPKLKLLPSEYFRRQGAVTFQYDPVGLANIPFTGERCLMWGSDYPHPEGTWPNSRKILDRQMAGVDEATIRKVVRDNAAELYRFTPPDELAHAGDLV
jgi:predicted TIM-barrel fold metal-dependent hydrolase